MSQDFEPQGHRPTTPAGGIPSPGSSHTERPKSRRQEPGKSPFPVLLSLLMAATLVAAWLVQKPNPIAAAPAPSPAPSPAAPVTAEAPAAPAAPTPAVATTPPSEEPGSGLKAEVASLAKRLDEVQAKLAAGKDESTDDLKPLQAKVDELAKVPDLVKPLPEKIESLGGRVEEIGKSLDDLKAQVAALDKGAAPAPKDVDAADQAMGDAVALFKARKYKEASAAFGKLAQAKADDARVLYYAALSNGFATGNWTAGETVSLVKKGIEWEKAGSPESSKIDEVFADLTKANGKDWLEGYRKQAK